MGAKAKIFIYKVGNEYLQTTGGWSPLTLRQDAGTINRNTTGGLNVTVNNGSGSSSNGGYATTNLVDTSKYGKIVFMYDHTRANDTGVENHLVGSIKDKATNTNPIIDRYYKSLGCKDEKDMISEVDIHDIENTNSYIGFSTGATAVSSTLNIKEIWFETKDDILTIDSHTQDKLTFSVNNYNNLIDINKIELFLNGRIVQQYNSFNAMEYTIDKSRLYIGTNKIEFKISYILNHIVESVTHYIDHEYKFVGLTEEADIELITRMNTIVINSKKAERDLLKDILISKNINIVNSDKMIDMIYKVDSLIEKPKFIDRYLFLNGDEFIDYTGGWREKEYWKTGSDYYTGTISSTVTDIGILKCTLKGESGTNYKTDHHAAFWHSNKLDLSEYETVVFIVTGYKSKVTLQAVDISKKVVASSGVNAIGEITLDISKLKGFHNIRAELFVANGEANIEISEIKLIAKKG